MTKDDQDQRGTKRSRRSCTRCHNLKVKCEGEVPCARCVRTSQGHTCQLWHILTGRPKKYQLKNTPTLPRVIDCEAGCAGEAETAGDLACSTPAAMQQAHPEASGLASAAVAATCAEPGRVADRAPMDLPNSVNDRDEAFRKLVSMLAENEDQLLAVPPPEAFRRLVSCTSPVYSHTATGHADSPWQWLNDMIQLWLFVGPSSRQRVLGYFRFWFHDGGAASAEGSASPSTASPVSMLFDEDSTTVAAVLLSLFTTAVAPTCQQHPEEALHLYHRILDDTLAFSIMGLPSSTRCCHPLLQAVGEADTMGANGRGSDIGSDAMCVLVTACGVPVDGRDCRNRPALHKAVEARSLCLSRLLVTLGANVGSDCLLRATPLTLSIQNQPNVDDPNDLGYKVMIFLLQQRADPNIQGDPNNLGYKVPLHMACEYDTPSTVQALVEHGATIDHEALYLAVSGPYVRAVEFLLQASSPELVHHKCEDMVERREKGQTILHAAVQNMSFWDSKRATKAQILELLLEHRAPVNEATHDGWSPLHYASADAIRLLLKHKAAVDIKNDDGLTALQLIRSGGGPMEDAQREESTQLLLDAMRSRTRHKRGVAPAQAEMCPIEVARMEAARQQAELEILAMYVLQCVLQLQAAISAGTDTAQLSDAICSAERLLQSTAAAGTGLELVLESARERLFVAQHEEKAAAKQAVIETTEQEFVALAMSQGDVPALAATEAALEADVLCVVCMSKRKEILFSPCEFACMGNSQRSDSVSAAGGHMCACEACAELVIDEEQGCPLCRENIDAKTKVYW